MILYVIAYWSVSFASSNLTYSMSDSVLNQLNITFWQNSSAKQIKHWSGFSSLFIFCITKTMFTIVAINYKQNLIFSNSVNLIIASVIHSGDQSILNHKITSKIWQFLEHTNQLSKTLTLIWLVFFSPSPTSSRSRSCQSPSPKRSIRGPSTRPIRTQTRMQTRIPLYWWYYWY